MTAARLTAPLLGVVALGGAAGATARWWIGEAVPEPDGFPWTTFTINVVGSLLLALLPLLSRHRMVTAALGPGLLGGFTTLSAASEQTRDLLAAGQVPLAAAYLFGTLAACLAAVHLGSLLSTPAQRADLVAAEGDA